MKILNLGCGAKTSSDPDVINVDWSIYLRLRKSGILRVLARPFLDGIRRQRFNSLPKNIMVQNLRKGLPFESQSVDVVYHSHFLEHLDRDAAVKFLREVKRTLKPGGIQRIVVPDLENIVKAYINHLASCQNNPDETKNHDAYVAAIIKQCVQKETSGTSHQPSVRRWVENAILGDARQRGQTHQWMYDTFNLSAILNDLGFNNPRICKYNESQIPNWNHYGLDVNESGDEYKPGSLYMETEV
jgi:SAM-dependent methyltransferase